MRHSWTWNPKICCFGILIFMYVYVSYWHLINNKFRERLSLNSPCLPKDIASKGAHLAHIPYPGMLSTMEDGLLSQEMKSHQPDKLCHRLSHLPSFLLKTHSSFLKLINSTIKKYFHINMAFHTEF